MKKMYGVITAMTTPFLEDGEVDFAALERHTDFLIDAGVNCLYPCGTTGEMLLMRPDQRKAVAEAVVRRADGRVIVYIHVGAVRLEETLELARHASAIGADGIGVVTPSFFNLRQDQVIDFYRTVARSVPEDFPVYMYNIPQCSANDITETVSAAVFEQCPNVVGMKYSWADMHRTLDYMASSGGDFSMLVGFDRLLLPALAMGCDGTVSGASSVFPEPFVALYQAWQAGDLDLARKQMWICNEIVNILGAGGDISALKYAIQLRGLPGGQVHRPLLPLTSEKQEELRAGLEKFLTLYPV